MSELLLYVGTDDKKYTVVQKKDGHIHALRYGEKWRDCVGDNLVLTLAQDLQSTREKLFSLRKSLEILVGASSKEELTAMLEFLKEWIKEETEAQK
jgi:hypothetical protein